MTTPERKIVEAVADSISAAYVAEYLTPPKYETKHLRQEKQEVIREHFPNRLPAAATVQCGCGAVLSSETLWSNHLADKLFPA